MYKGYLDGLLIVEANSIPYVKARLDEEEEIFGWHCYGAIVRGKKIIRMKDYADKLDGKEPKWTTLQMPIKYMTIVE